MKRSLSALFALMAFVTPALAQTRALPPGEIRANGDITFGNALKLGKREAGKTIITPDTLQILGSGSTGDASIFTAPSAGLGVDTTLSVLLAAAQPRVATNAALKAVLLPYSRIRRDGFYAAGDGGAMDYTWSPSNCAAADDGAQVQPPGRTGCWIAEPSARITPQVWGAKGDGNSDDGPAIRAACAYSAQIGMPLSIPRRQYAVKSLDPSGLGAIVLGTGAAGGAPAAAQTCDMEGTNAALLPDQAFSHGPTFILGNGLNRPLVYMRKNTRTPLWSGLYLVGNRGGQTGWAGGPNGKLYAVQIEDEPQSSGESAMRLDRVIIRDGYNGALYLGGGRGGLWCKDSWFHYSGQTTGDVALWLAGYDVTRINCQIGGNAGIGVYYAQGSQYQTIGGAIFFNGGPGTRVNGYAVQYLQEQGVNYQSNGQEGIKVFKNPTFPNSQAGAHSFSQITFDSNSASASGTYSDVWIDSSTIVSLDQPNFVGRAYTTASYSLPKYNVELVGENRVYVTSPSFGTGQSAAVAFTNGCAQLVGNFNVTCAWTPSFGGAGTAGSPAYISQVGTMARNGNEVTARFTVQTSSLGGASGSAVIRGLPLFAGAAANDNGACTISSYSGWTSPAGFNNLSALIPPNTNAVYLARNGSGQTGDLVSVSEFAANMKLVGMCSYHVDK
ncbi:hypothetical protein [Methylorubrum sp. DB1722]|uniref:hypothetical protein n=1 Tax=Methylorubrum sp. DB1722 TaxID=2478916 RepID=UPI0018E34F80|nr:hypothetical protein [Methylorubrum sp. DB1722]